MANQNSKRNAFVLKSYDINPKPTKLLKLILKQKGETVNSGFITNDYKERACPCDQKHKVPKKDVLKVITEFQQNRKRLPNLIHFPLLEAFLPETNLIFEYLMPNNLWLNGDAVMNSKEPILNHCMTYELRTNDGAPARYWFSESSWKIAALKGDFAVIKHLHRDGIKGCTHEIMDIVAEQNYVDILRFLIKNRVEGCSEKAIIKAAENGHLLAVEILYDCLHDDPNPDVRVMDSACKNGHMEVVTFLLNNKFKYSSLSILYASEKGFFDILRLLDDHRSLSVEDDEF